jgi:AraC-like DNA-binding protein
MIAKLNIFKAVRRLEAETGKHYTIQDIAREAGMHRHTVASLLDGREDKTLGKVLAFFADEGMPVTINDLFTVTDDSPLITGD